MVSSGENPKNTQYNDLIERKVTLQRNKFSDNMMLFIKVHLITWNINYCMLLASTLHQFVFALLEEG